MANPEISVQIPVRDGGDLFLGTLECLARQRTDGIPWELVIVDDGSRVPVEREFEGILSSFPRGADLRILRREGPGSRPEARNLALKAGRAPVALLMDGDLAFEPDLLAGHLRERESAGAEFLMGARVNAHSPGATRWQKWFDSRAMGNRPSGPFPWKYFITGNLSVNPEKLLSAGGFDPGIDRYGGEDIEAGLRLWKRGAVFHWNPGITVRHMDTVTVEGHSRKMLEYGATGLKRTLDLHPEAAGLLGSNWVKPMFSRPADPGTVLMRLLCRVALAPGFYRGVLRYMARHGRPMAGFTYLSVGACLIGLSGRDFRK